MNNDNQPPESGEEIYQPSSENAPQPPKKYGRLLAFLLVAGLLLAILFVTGIVVIFRHASSKAESAIKVSNRFLTSLQQHDYETAYGLLTPAAQAVTPPQKLKKIEEMVEKTHGRLQSFSHPQWRAGAYPGYSVYNLSYQAVYKNDASQIYVVVVDNSEGLGIYGFQYQM